MRKPNNWFFLYFLWWHCMGNCLAQQAPITRFTIRDGLVQQQVRCFLEDRRGYTWIGTRAGLSRFDGQQIQKFGPKEGMSDLPIYVMVEGTDGTIWYRSRDQVLRFDGIRETRLDTLSSAFWMQQAPRLWTILNVALLRQLLAPRFPDLQSLSDEAIILYEDDAHTMVLDPVQKKAWYLTQTACTPVPVPAHFPRQVSLDKSLRYFVTTDYTYYTCVKGSLQMVARYSPKERAVQLLHPAAPLIFHALVGGQLVYWLRRGNRYEELDLPAFNRIDHVYARDTSRILIATDEGFAVQNFDGPSWVPSQGIGYPWSVQSDKHGNIWVGSYQEGVYCFSPDGRTQQLYGFPRDGKEDHQIFPGVFRGPDGTLWFGGYRGVYHIADQQLRLRRFNEPIEAICWFPARQCYLVGGSRVYALGREGQLLSTFAQLGPDTEINALLTDAQNQVWVATNHGLYLFDATGKSLPIFQKNSNCKCLYEDAAGTIWTTCGNKLFAYDTQHHALRERAHFFNASAINNLVGLPQQRLALITDLDFMVLDITEAETPKVLLHWSTQNGYKLLESGENGAHFDGKYVWIPGSNGIQRIALADLMRSQDLLACLRVDAINRRPCSINDTLPAQTVYANQVILSLNVIHWQADICTFSASINGGPWRSMGTTLTPLLTGLEHGANRVRIRAMYPGGQLEAQCLIQAEYAFAEPFIIYLLLGLAGLIIILLIYNGYRQRKLREQLTQADHNAVLAQLHPHFFFNLLSSLQYAIAKQTKEVANQHLLQIARLVREILEFSRNPAASKSEVVTTITLAQECAFLERYVALESVQQRYPFQFQIELDLEESAENWHIPPLLVQPLVENALLHGIRPRKDDLGVLRITIRSKGTQLRILVIDNGVGLQAKKTQTPFFMEYTSRGSTLLQKRLELLRKLGYQADLHIYPGEVEGTIAALTLQSFHLKPS
jgi:hypothetical protein